MKPWIAMTLVFVCLANFGVSTLIGMLYVAQGYGVHPVIAGVSALASIVIGLWAAGEVQE